MIKTCVAITNDGIRENVDMETQLPKVKFYFSLHELNVSNPIPCTQTSLTAEQQAAFAKFWKNYKDKVCLFIHTEKYRVPQCNGVSLQQILDQVKKDLVWNNRLEKFAWRVDLKTKTRKIADEINEPCAIIELNIVNGAQVSQQTEHVFVFRLTRDDDNRVKKMAKRSCDSK